MSAAFRALILAGGAAMGLTAEAGGQPRTAIPWLSDSLTAPAAAPAPRPRPIAPGSPEAPGITVTPLGAVNRDAVGLLQPQTSGLPRRLWGEASGERVRDLILGLADQGVPASRALFRTLLLAEADPPAPSDPPDQALIARVDRLLELGAIEEAEALLRAAGPDTPELFRRWFDIGLLANRAQDQCAALRQNPALSPTLPARVVCLARGGDWNAAEITLILGQDVGAISPEQEALLARFLDPEIFEGEPPPPIPRPLTALDFTLREAVGLPRPSGALPLAFLWSDVDVHAPMRMRISAGERLVRAGSTAPNALFEAYRAGAPAASGGVWDRARAVQALDAALAGDAPDDLAAALAAADAALSEAGLRVAFAESYAPALAALGPDALPAGARGRAAELALLAGDGAAAARLAGAAPDPRMAAALAVAGAAPAQDAPEDARVAAALRGLAGGAAADERQRRIVATIAAGGAGEALIEALGLLAAGPDIDPASLEAALFAVTAAGQRDAARAIAVETLLLPGGE